MLSSVRAGYKRVAFLSALSFLFRVRDLFTFLPFLISAMLSCAQQFQHYSSCLRSNWSNYIASRPKTSLYEDLLCMLILLLRLLVVFAVVTVIPKIPPFLVAMLYFGLTVYLYVSPFLLVPILIGQAAQDIISISLVIHRCLRGIFRCNYLDIIIVAFCNTVKILVFAVTKTYTLAPIAAGNMLCALHTGVNPPLQWLAAMVSRTSPTRVVTQAYDALDYGLYSLATGVLSVTPRFLHAVSQAVRFSSGVLDGALLWPGDIELYPSLSAFCKSARFALHSIEFVLLSLIGIVGMVLPFVLYALISIVAVCLYLLGAMSQQMVPPVLTIVWLIRSIISGLLRPCILAFNTIKLLSKRLMDIIKTSMQPHVLVYAMYTCLQAVYCMLVWLALLSSITIGAISSVLIPFFLSLVVKSLSLLFNPYSTLLLVIDTAAAPLSTSATHPLHPVSKQGSI